LTRRIRILAVVAGVALILFVPDTALAWGPAAHMQVGLDLLRSLNLFPPSISALLGAYPVDFLYGNLAADISMAKNYVPTGRHCHQWHMSNEIHEAAGDDPQLRTVAIGYQCHLAADVSAHNSFVPRMFLMTSSTRSLGHSYWEHRMDVEVGLRFAALARWVVTGFDHERTDDLFREVLEDTLFSFGTNRRLFRGMIRIGDNQNWQAIFDAVVDNSRWELDRETVDAYRRRGFEDAADVLLRGDASPAAEADPIGTAALARARRLRRALARQGA